jgi:hypothetical protein
VKHESICLKKPVSNGMNQGVHAYFSYDLILRIAHDVEVAVEKVRYLNFLQERHRQDETQSATAVNMTKNEQPIFFFDVDNCLYVWHLHEC